MSKDFKQYDGRWASHSYCRITMKAAGCGPTAVADIFYNFDTSITPVKVADWFAKNGYESYKQGTVWTGIPAYFNKHGAKAVQLNAGSLYGNRNSSAEDNWKSKMKTGNYWGILLMGKGYWTGGGHYIAVTAYKDGKYYVMDPASVNRTGWHSWDAFEGVVKIFYLIDLPEKKKTKNTTKSAKSSSKKVTYYGKYTGKSDKINKVLKAVGVPLKYRGTWKRRKAVAAANGIRDYTGSEKQNMRLIELAKKGKLVKV